MSILLSLIVLLEAKSKKSRSAGVGARQKKGLTQVMLPIAFPSDDRADGELDLCFIRRSRACLVLLHLARSVSGTGLYQFVLYM